MLWRRSLSTLSTYSEHLPLKFVPAHVPVQPSQSAQLQQFIFTKRKLLCLTGAGISTESGMPDYRGEGVGLYATSKRRPMQYKDFISSPAFRQRYWARNYIGWPSFSSLQPNPTHEFLSRLEKDDPQRLLWLITQNVDALHLKAGSRKVTELHGTAFQVVCLKCSHMITRNEFQEQLKELNPSFQVDELVFRPDADVELSDEQVLSFRVAGCRQCENGVMKPYIVYFGENVPKTRVEFLYKLLEECDSLLVLGSSMQVFSGYRFALKASQLKKPICIVSIGATRADHLADLRFDNVRCGDILSNISI